MRTIDKKIDDGILKFTFTNLEGDVFSYFLMNPADVGIAARCEELSDFFENKKDIPEGEISAKEASNFNDELQEKINYLLGYDASKTLFGGLVTATTILPDGTMFASSVFESILEAVKPEIEKRGAAMAARISEYTEDYE